MALKKMMIRILGKQPVLMNRVPLDFGNTSETRTRKMKSSREEEAEAAAYRTKDGRLALPAAAFWKGLKGASSIKVTGSRKALSTLLMENGTILWKPEDTIVEDMAGVAMYEIGTNKPITEYELDVRDVNVNNARVMRVRPKVRDWWCEFEVEYEDRVVSTDLYRLGFVTAGFYKGVGDFRKEHGGLYFGAYQVENPLSNQPYHMDDFKI